jgi:hypothetical protein
MKRLGGFVMDPPCHSYRQAYIMYFHRYDYRGHILAYIFQSLSWHKYSFLLMFVEFSHV